MCPAGCAPASRPRPALRLRSSLILTLPSLPGQLWSHIWRYRGSLWFRMSLCPPNHLCLSLAYNQWEAGRPKLSTCIHREAPARRWEAEGRGWVFPSGLGPSVRRPRPTAFQEPPLLFGADPVSFSSQRQELPPGLGMLSPQCGGSCWGAYHPSWLP